ncbi:hypothetical protein P175DRAFT_0527138 [Aspergillus ochraceoroseus IBT 24754]|uniref:Uncharacterized protein n=1 Tax=Aspergillus ochraceoroseus IBT 24754 TaxID=1392256 RepID=A0A2T5M5C1_9EURO|nr:uncharacterized protein P175DRAFT_0527138 [Aspergillus ochraceoroseus IBT 24754]PTU23696.1 hypothetical protein P175DRAFT_0527138 [Aspergillus ochraceoroseus IBT 24754]
MPRSFASSRSSQSDKKNQNSLSSKSDQLATNEPPLSLRSMQHLDRDGKVIADPDRSNPTRARLERPLDTIRGFEAAIEARRGQNIL